jgi:DNA-binding CsgD family transcriptional regulator
VGGRIYSSGLIGRAAEIAALRAELAEAQAGRGRLVLVEGDAGIGKTRLVEEFTTGLEGVRVLAGGGIPLASDTPYAPVLGILRALAQVYPPAAAALMPKQSGRMDPYGPTRLLAAVADALRAAAAETPVVLLVEDLHWADASTQGLVSFLARGIRADPVLLVVTVRAEELDPARPVTVLISELARLPHAGRLLLAPLDAAGVSRLAAEITGLPPSVQLTGRLMRRAAGNPFFTEELLAADPAAATLPVSIGEVLATRVARLPEAGQRVLGAASVLGRAMAYQLLAEVAHASDLDDGLAAAVSHRMLEPQGDGYSFRHPLIQEAVYARLLPSARQALHARAAAALTKMPAPAEAAALAINAVQITFHWQHAGEAENAMEAAIHAGDLAQAAYAPAEALAQYTLAIDGLQSLQERQAVAASGTTEVSLMERAAEAASAAGDHTRAQELAHQALARTDAAIEPVQAALRLERLGRFSWLAGDLATSRQAYQDAQQVIPDQPSPARARVLAATAQRLMLDEQHLSARGYAEQAVAESEAVGARAEEGHARTTLGTILAALGCHAAGVEMIKAGLSIARQTGDSTEVARCHVNLTEVLTRARRAEEAERAAREGVAEATAHGLGRTHAAAVLGNLLEALFLLGRWDELLVRASAALEEEPELRVAVSIRTPRCRVALARGNLSAAAADVAAITSALGATLDSYDSSRLAVLEAMLANARGDVQSASTQARNALKIAAGTDDVSAHLETAALAIRIEADALDAARLTGRRADPSATRVRAERILAGAQEAAAQLSQSEGCASPVFAMFETIAAAELGRIPGPADPDLWHQVATCELADRYLVSYARLQQAGVLLASRRRREATAALQEAETAARELAAAPLLTRIAALARYGRVDLTSPAPAPPSAPDPMGLTAREHEVIALLSEGMANAEIAKTLYISEKTVSVHVSNILRKLGVTSRLQAAAAYSRQARTG